MKQRSARLAVIGVLVLCVLALVLLVGRNLLLDQATSAMKSEQFDRAATKLKLLASVGDSTAQSLLGDSYAYGWGVPKNDEHAIYWYRRAGTSDRSVSDPAAPAMYYVGKHYLEATPGDKSEARKWFAWSARGGFSKAHEDLEKMR